LAKRNPPQVSPADGLSVEYAPPIRPTALPRNSENVAPIVSFVGEYSAHFAREDFPRVHAIGIFPLGFSHPGESRRAAIRFCDAIPNWVG
jgi:hypothetical protein